MAEIVITIDGPAASGKSTVAHLLAEQMGAGFLDTGAMYRAVTLAAMRAKVDLGNEARLLDVLKNTRFEFRPCAGGLAVSIDGNDATVEIRDAAVTANARHIAAAPAVRAKLVEMQRQFAAAQSRVVTEGRDQGTVAFPDAQVKFYLTASLDERTKRRGMELADKGACSKPDEIRRAIEQRDRSDENRSVGPMRPAADAISIDTTSMTIEEVVEEMLACVRRKCPQVR